MSLFCVQKKESLLSFTDFLSGFLFQVILIKNFLYGSPGRNHGEYFIILVNDAVDHYGTAKLYGLAYSRLQLFFLCHTDTDSTHGLCQFDKIHIVIKNCIRVTLSVEQCLPLANHSKYMVIDDNLDDRNVISRSRSDLIHIHTETAVTGDIDHRFIRAANLCSDCSSKTISHRTKTAGGQKLMGLLIFIILGSPHLMLSDFCDDQGISFCDPVKLFHHIGCSQTCRIVFQRELILIALDVFYPFLMGIFFHFRKETFQHFFYITDNRSVYYHVLIDLCRIHIDLKDFGIFCKFGYFSYHTVTETGADDDQKVTVRHTKVGSLGSVHTDHTTGESLPVWENEKALGHICFSRELNVGKNTSLSAIKIKDYLRTASVYLPYWDQRMADELIRKFHLDVKQKIGRLSKGMVSMVTIIVALASKADFTFLDEPVSGLDVVAREQFYRILLDEFTETGRTFVISTHIMEEAADLFEEVVMIKNGKLLLKENTQELLEACVHISGKAEEVDRAAEGLEKHQEERLGRSKSLMVRLKKGQKIGKADVTVQPMSLEKVFVALCGEEE